MRSIRRFNGGSFGFGIIITTCFSLAGYMNNLLYVIKGTGAIDAEMVLSIVGAVFFPLGVIHGIYLWF